MSQRGESSDVGDIIEGSSSSDEDDSADLERHVKVEVVSDENRRMV